MKFMPLRVFLRGGYQQNDGPIIVTKNGYPYFTVLPGLVAKAATDVQNDSPVLSSDEPKSKRSSRG